jgi:acetyl/propionyl-CoA carboxylase alpha subunit
MGDVDKILIANRGEIARRIIRSCRSLGLKTVAIYSEADAGAAHVAEADEGYAVGPPRAQESYLVIERILDAARASGAQAIHPGYGFLSENAHFARAVENAGLTWIGPSPATIELMGDKGRAREAAAASGVPVVPGSRRFRPDDLAGLDAAAAALGFPLLVKAAMGGGGIGMRRVDSADKLLAAITGTQSMAAKAFGDGSTYLERFIGKARHIEIQVFGFGDGEAIHLYERDCSLQRRFQKVIEESPAPDLPPEVRRRMAEAAVAICRTTRYRGAGTVEYIVDANTFDFFFLEMNTRIQVEHPVTEMVTGVDLVGMQIELARGRLTYADQPQIAHRGSAIECRLYAENPAKMFMPSPGPLTVFRLPTANETVRIDSGYREGDVMTPFYDPLISKIVVWGATRAEAIERSKEALRSCRVEGIKTNREFLLACLQDPLFAAGDVSTGFIEQRHKLLIASAQATQPVQ